MLLQGVLQPKERHLACLDMLWLHTRDEPLGKLLSWGAYRIPFQAATDLRNMWRQLSSHILHPGKSPTEMGHREVSLETLPLSLPRNQFLHTCIINGSNILTAQREVNALTCYSPPPPAQSCDPSLKVANQGTWESGSERCISMGTMTTENGHSSKIGDATCVRRQVVLYYTF
jgi:hypothetical protein